MNELIVTLEEGKKVNAHYNGHIIKTDQPVRGGGEGSAPAPFDLFLASIGTCAGIYIKSFCEQRGISTHNIRIIQKMEYDPNARLFGKIHLEIEVPDDFPEKYKKALISSAELCAVKKHIDTAPEFATRVVVGSSELVTERI